MDESAADDDCGRGVDRETELKWNLQLAKQTAGLRHFKNQRRGGNYLLH